MSYPARAEGLVNSTLQLWVNSRVDYFFRLSSATCLWIHTICTVPIPTSRPHYLSFLKPLMASDSSSGFFLISGRGYFTFFTDTQSTTEKVEEKNKRTNTDLVWLQAQESEVCETFCAFCELTQACTRAKTLTKPLAMLTHVGHLGISGSTGLSSRLSDFCSSLFSVQLSSLSTVFFCSLLLNAFFCSLLLIVFLRLLLDLPFLNHFGSRAQSLCVGFAPQ